MFSDFDNDDKARIREAQVPLQDAAASFRIEEARFSPSGMGPGSSERSWRPMEVLRATRGSTPLAAGTAVLMTTLVPFWSSTPEVYA